MKKAILAILVLSVAMLSSCSNEHIGYAYVATNGDCGYVVKVEADVNVNDITMSKCMPLADATRLSDDLNHTMGRNWSSSRARGNGQ